MLFFLVREIFLRQEEFFTDLDNIKKHHPYFQDSNNVPVVSGYEDYCNQDTLIAKFLAIREFWDRIDEHKRDRIWKFFQAGLRIGAMASNDGTLLRYIDYLVNATKGCKTTSDFSRVKTLSYGEYIPLVLGHLQRIHISISISVSTYIVAPSRHVSGGRPSVCLAAVHRLLWRS